MTLAIEGWNADNLESRALFERTVASLARQTFPVGDCEVFVAVDADVPHQELAWIRDSIPNAQFVRVQGSTYYRIKNAAVRSTTREVIAFADSDVAYEPEWLERLLTALSGRDGVVAGNTQFDEGFLSQTLNLAEWAASRPGSGPTDWFYGNNLACRRELLERYGFREDLGQGGGGGVDILREQLRANAVPIWFCAEARGYHHLAPFWPKYTRLGAYQIHFRRLAPTLRWSWLASVPVLAPFLVCGGLLLKSWRRARLLRAALPLRGWSLPGYILSLAYVQCVVLMGAAAYAWLPGWVISHRDWFDVPTVGTADLAREAPTGDRL